MARVAAPIYLVRCCRQATYLKAVGSSTRGPKILKLPAYRSFLESMFKLRLQSSTVSEAWNTIYALADSWDGNLPGIRNGHRSLRASGYFGKISKRHGQESAAGLWIFANTQPPAWPKKQIRTRHSRRDGAGGPLEGPGEPRAGHAVRNLTRERLTELRDPVAIAGRTYGCAHLRRGENGFRIVPV